MTEPTVEQVQIPPATVKAPRKKKERTPEEEAEFKRKQLETLQKARAVKAEKKRLEKDTQVSTPAVEKDKPEDEGSEEEASVVYYEPPPKDPIKKQKKVEREKKLDELHTMISTLFNEKKEKQNVKKVVKKVKSNPVAAHHKKEIQKMAALNLFE